MLMVLAGISIATLTGENGIIGKAREAKEKTEIAEVIEKAKMDLLEAQVQNDGSLTSTDLRTVLEKYFDGVPPEISPDDLSTLTLTTKTEYGSHNITLSDVWNGTTSSAVAKTYTVTYDVNGGSQGPSNQTKTKGKDLILSSEKPTRPGYVFWGWGEDNNSLAYQPGDTYNKDSNITLYAIWGIQFSPSTGGETTTTQISSNTNQYETNIFSANVPSGVTIKLEYRLSKSTESSIGLYYKIDDGNTVPQFKLSEGSSHEDQFVWKNNSENAVKFSFWIEGGGHAGTSMGLASGRVSVIEIKDDQGRPIAFGNSE